ncbi:HXXXD-type acyl-transferase family protein [Forsythia ovata]|uniref:HXXXD-type acyl-transferase family protein n=1 Tax=Forsythia ovata TaxID=205694 RepID=A0ABD1X4J0_9LAMI
MLSCHCIQKEGYVYITCNDAGVDFIHASGSNIHVRYVLGSIDVPDEVKGFFAFDQKVSYEGHFSSILAIQVTELADSVFIGCVVNHAITDGTFFWNFFNAFAEVSRGVNRISRTSDYRRDSVLISSAMLKFPASGPKVSFSGDAPLRERIFSFSRKSIQKLKPVGEF